jgi:antitoxin ParD1/3/4
MRARNVNFTKHHDEFIDQRVRSGHFNNASEVVREGLRLLEQELNEEQARIKWLRGATDDVLAEFDRGEGIPLSSPEEVKALLRGTLTEVRTSHG